VRTTQDSVLKHTWIDVGVRPKLVVQADIQDWQLRAIADEKHYENLPHARSVAHQINLLPLTMTTPNAIHS
jgi:hypothetical protein